MSGQQTSIKNLRDGISQSGRVQPALQPDYALVDERSAEDLLIFAQAYAKELRYFNEQNQADGDWSGFLDGTADEIAAYLENPGLFESDTNKKAWYTRPHFVLFLTFIKLLRQAQIRMNELTRRHLDFYFREALALTSRQAVPDHVNVLVELADGQNQFLLPQDSLLAAGKDSLGLDLFYRTEQDIVANQAMVDSLKNLFVKKQMIGIRDVRGNSDLQPVLPVFKTLENETQPEKTFMCMLAIALGEPNPGDAMATYPGYSKTPVLSDFDALLGFIRSDNCLPLSAFRTLMQLKQKLGVPQDLRWNEINKILQDAGNSHISNFIKNFAEPDNFDKNLLAALGLTSWGAFFDTLPEVDDIYDLYRLRERTDVKSFIDQNKLYMPFNDFVTMMERIDAIYKDWRKIYDILRAAGKKKNPGQPPQPPKLREYDPHKFDTLTGNTLGKIDFSKLDKLNIKTFDGCYHEILTLEYYFHMPAESFGLIRQINAKANAAPWEWEQAYSILENAHIDKCMKDCHASRDAQGFEAMIQFALGDPEPGDNLPDAMDFMKLDAASDAQYIRGKLYLEPANFQYIQDTEKKQQSAASKPNEEDWIKAYRMLELAQRRKRGAPQTQIVKWENVCTTDHAAAVDAATPWNAFGAGLATPADTGFAIASPLLALAEGLRTITLTLDFSEECFEEEICNAALTEPFPFSFLLSTQEKMVLAQTATSALVNVSMALLPPEAASAKKTVTTRALQITIKLDPQFPPVAPCTSAPCIQTPWPVLQILLADIPEKNDAIHRAFASLILEKVSLKVEVEGLSSLTLQNDDGVLNARKPFEPFGFTPVAGSSFYFAHPELSSKKLDSLTANINWLGAPDNLSVYYQGYADYEQPAKDPASPIADNSGFHAQLKLYDNRGVFPVAGIQLFNADKADVKKGATATSKNTIVLTDDSFIKTCPGYGPNLHPLIAEEVLEWNRYWQIELLEPDFQHALYPRAATAYANRSDAGKPAPYIVNPPYTPKIKHLTLDYSVSVEIKPADGNPATVDKLYHIEPFGYRELAIDDQKHWLPQYTNEGELFIGIKDLAPPQSLSLLFQIAADSADPNLAREPVHWCYLSGDRWESLEQGGLLADNTDGLLNSGIVSFALPAAEPGSLLPPDLYWIRAGIAKNSQSVGDMVAIRAQAVSAVFNDRENAPDHLDQPLRANSITGLAAPLPEVKAIHQPYSSSGGLGPEQAGRFYTRVSERLRHKNRAMTSWDYERLILEAFPGIYKVKCLPAGSSADPRRTDDIKIIVVPDIRGKQPFTPFEPKAPTDKILQIERYINNQGSPMARCTVNNPTYIRLKVRLGVRFNQTSNLGYYQQALNQALQRYLAPWAYDDSAEIVFGGKINANLIVNFVERLDYVDYVAGIKLFTTIEGDTLPKQADAEFAVDPESILVSDREHQIDLITQETYQEKYFTGINYMKIGLDFTIA